METLIRKGLVLSFNYSHVSLSLWPPARIEGRARAELVDSQSMKQHETTKDCSKKTERTRDAESRKFLSTTKTFGKPWPSFESKPKQTSNAALPGNAWPDDVPILVLALLLSQAWHGAKEAWLRTPPKQFASLQAENTTTKQHIQTLLKSFVSNLDLSQKHSVQPACLAGASLTPAMSSAKGTFHRR